MKYPDQNALNAFIRYLSEQERSPATVEKYRRALERFLGWLPAEEAISKTMVIRYREHLTRSLAPASVNASLAALNGFFRFLSRPEWVVKPLRIQRKVFSTEKDELSREEYLRLVETAEKWDERMSLLLQLMASTGLRVSEIRYVTTEAVAEKTVTIRLKGKIRTVLLPEALCRKLRQYQKSRRIASGPLFLSRRGRVMDRREIWAQMKRLSQKAGVSPEKVFPHNLRHLFAKCFYARQKDVVKLADLLGHSSVETTRIYLRTSGQEHRALLEDLRLIS